MPANKSADKALAALKGNASKTLGLTVGKHTGVEPETFMPRAGRPCSLQPIHVQLKRLTREWCRCAIATGDPVPSSVSRQDLPDHVPGPRRAIQVAPRPRPHLALVSIGCEALQRRSTRQTGVVRVARRELYWTSASAGSGAASIRLLPVRTAGGFRCHGSRAGKGQRRRADVAHVVQLGRLGGQGWVGRGASAELLHEQLEGRIVVGNEEQMIFTSILKLISSTENMGRLLEQ